MTGRPRYSVDRSEPGHGDGVRREESELKERNILPKVSETRGGSEGDRSRPQGRDA